MKLTVLVVYAGLLIALGIDGRADQNQERAAAEQQRIQDAEHAKVVADANQRVADLYDKATAALHAKDIGGALKLLQQVQQVSNATNQAVASTLIDKIQLSSNPARLREVLIGLSDADFNAFATSKIRPDFLKLGFEALTDQAMSLAAKEVPAARTEREKRAKLAAEAAARAAQDAQAKADADRREREAAAAAERELAEAAAKEVQDKHDAFSNLLAASNVTMVTHISVDRDQDIWEATLTVDDIWHLRNKQIRLEDAQSLWKAWALIASPKDPDSARIKIVDLNGNEVGGSRVWGGSLIWVQD